jgi:hypothetical protein
LTAAKALCMTGFKEVWDFEAKYANLQWTQERLDER